MHILKLSAVETQKSGAAPNQQETADYIASVSRKLSEMASSVGMPFVAYLLDVTVQQALKQDCEPRQRQSDTHDCKLRRRQSDTQDCKLRRRRTDTH